MLKKCPVCNSSRFKQVGGALVCERCGYVWRKMSMDFKKANEL